MRSASSRMSAPSSCSAGSALEQEAQQRPRLRDALARVGELGGVEDEHVAQRLAQAPAGQGVVADVGHAGRVERRAADRQQAIAHRGRHPRVDAVRDHVVEAARRRRERPRSPAPRASRCPARARRRAPGRARSPAARRRRPRSSPPGSATAIGTRLPASPQPSSRTRQRSGAAGAQAEERGQRRQAVGMGLGERVPRIGDRVVGRPRGRAERSERLVGLAVPAHPDRRGEAAVGLLLACRTSRSSRSSARSSRAAPRPSPRRSGSR